MQTIVLAPASLALVRSRAPNVVTRPDTLDFRTLTPERGGLFDYKIFGPGTVIDAPTIADDDPVKPRNTAFGRIVLALPLAHPWFADDAVAAHPELVLAELPVLPPDLRPLTRLADDRWQSSPINDLYRRVIERNHRLVRLVEVGAPAEIVANERDELARSLLALFDNEVQPTPVVDRDGRPLMSLRGMCGLDVGIEAALRELDNANGSARTFGLHRLAAVIFALGFEIRTI